MSVVIHETVTVDEYRDQRELYLWFGWLYGLTVDGGAGVTLEIRTLPLAQVARRGVVDDVRFAAFFEAVGYAQTCLNAAGRPLDAIADHAEKLGAIFDALVEVDQ